MWRACARGDGRRQRAAAAAALGAAARSLTSRLRLLFDACRHAEARDDAPAALGRAELKRLFELVYALVLALAETRAAAAAATSRRLMCTRRQHRPSCARRDRPMARPPRPPPRRSPAIDTRALVEGALGPRPPPPRARALAAAEGRPTTSRAMRSCSSRWLLPLMHEALGGFIHLCCLGARGGVAAARRERARSRRRARLLASRGARAARRARGC